MKNPCLFRFVLTLALMIFGTASYADIYQDPLPAEQRAGDIRYRTGGIGQEESDALRAAISQYSLTMTFSVREGARSAFQTNVAVLVQKSDGAVTFNSTVAGPYLLLDLLPGKYRVTATAYGIPMTREVSITASERPKLTFDWPEQVRARP